MRKYINNVLIGLDQLGNALAGGNPDNTISGRTGYFAIHSGYYTKWFWMLMQFIIDFTFFPIDGWHHCQMAYEAEKDEEFYALRKFAIFIFVLITVVCCLVLSIIFYFVYLIRAIIKATQKRKKERGK